MKMRPLPLVLCAVPLALSLAGCQNKASNDPAGAETSQAAAVDAKPGLSLSGGSVVLPAVKGNPAAAYFTLTNGSDKEVALAAVSVDGAEKAEMHETSGGAMAPLPSLTLKPDETASFAPGGKHVMVFGLGDKVAAGGTVETTLTFADGDKLSAQFAVTPPGGMMGDDMHHGDMH